MTTLKGKPHPFLNKLSTEPEASTLTSIHSNLNQCGIKSFSTDQSTQTPCFLTQLKSLNSNININEKTYFMELSFSDYNILESFTNRRSTITFSADKTVFQDQLSASYDLELTVPKAATEVLVSEDLIPDTLDHELLVPKTEVETSSDESTHQVDALCDQNDHPYCKVTTTNLSYGESSQLQETQHPILDTPENPTLKVTDVRNEEYINDVNFPKNRNDAKFAEIVCKDDVALFEKVKSEGSCRVKCINSISDSSHFEATCQDSQPTCSSSIPNIVKIRKASPVLVLNLKPLEQQKKGKKNSHICNFCQLTYSTNSLLQSHLRSHVFPVPYSCPDFEEPKGLAHLRKLLKRKKITRKTNKLKIIDGDESASSPLKVDLLKFKLKKSFVCPDCDSSFKRMSRLKIHLLKHKKVNFHDCPDCGKSFMMEKNLKKHSQIHFPYPCPHCNKFFSIESRLKIHLLTHMCTKCDEIFSSKSDLKKHFLNHSSINPYVCTFCDKRFSNKTAKMHHMRKHTGLKPLTTVRDSPKLSKLPYDHRPQVVNLE